VTEERMRVLNILLARGADVNAHGFLGGTPLHIAASQGYTNAVGLLLDHGADVNARSDSRGTPLHEAAQQGRLAAVNLLLELGADVNARSNYNTPLSLAVRFRHKEIVMTLLDHGADARIVDHRGMSLIDELVDFQGPWTPTHREIAEMVIEAGADVRKPNAEGRTPLHSAAGRGMVDVASFLITKGADINAKDASGMTPLHRAVSQKQLEMVEFLLAKGADPNVKDKSGRTPIYDAWGSGVDARIKAVLQEHGGRGAFGEPDSTKSFRQ